MTLVQWAALAAAGLLGGVALLQAALAVGAPWGAYAWGGRHRGVLPPRLQLGSALSVPILLIMAMMVLIRAGILYPAWQKAMYWPAWGVFCFLVMNVAGNFKSESREERRVMGPIAAVLAGLVGFVAWSSL